MPETFTESELERAYEIGIKDGRTHAIVEISSAIRALTEQRDSPKPSRMPFYDYFHYARAAILASREET